MWSPRSSSPSRQPGMKQVSLTGTDRHAGWMPAQRRNVPHRTVAAVGIYDFRTFAEYDGVRSGPASLRRDFGLVVHWANATSAALDLGGVLRCGTRFETTDETLVLAGQRERRAALGQAGTLHEWR